MSESFALRVLYVILISLPFHITKSRTRDNNCYQPSVMDLQWIDSCPKYCLNMSYTREGTLSSVAYVTEVVEVPIGHFAVILTDVNSKRSTLYNLTAKLCDIKVTLSKIPMYNSIMETFKKSNYTFQCPITIGIHHMTNISIDQRNPLLMLLYRQKTYFTVSGGMSKELPDKSRTRLTAYNITAKIIRRACDRKRD